MTGNTPAEAIDNFVKPLRMAVLCISKAVVVAANRYDDDLAAPRALLFGGFEQSQIECRDDLVLEASHYFRVIEAEGEAGPYRCRTLAYSYDFRHPDGPSVLAYHWHPDSTVTTPHVHAHQYTNPVDLTKVHAATGRVSLESIVRMAITEFGAARRRDDWEQVLTESEQAFDKWREW